MGKISVLKTATLESSLQEPDPDMALVHAGLGHAGGRPPVSLLAFLQEENLRLRIRVAELQEDTTALREALRHN
jgi:hypothetical protein